MEQIVKREGKRFEDMVIELPGRPPAMLDVDVAKAYGVETIRLNEARQNNPRKFREGKDYFQVTIEDIENFDNLREALKFRPTLPFFYTRSGTHMFATILRTDEAIDIALDIVDGFGRYERLIEEIKTGRLHIKPTPAPMPVDVITNLKKELLSKNLLWGKIMRYMDMGLTRREICKLVERDKSTVRCHVRRMEACGLIAPPSNLPVRQRTAEHLH